ncbi:hypothetical protein HAP48_0004330 [Bradyrhizobium septentrionale]|uniref:Uncharacterized protein n=1 Tax=Bradyrhizobium septentrionale TaxID=1404411 RepID=A0A973W6G0_9BRAD|nr:hypothetical protein [Bradyrhizobium septentrionale]UGY16774.1 hypothetical protein HAP48_0004330 [Bradyrhizobium septentrionale]
MKLIDWFRGKKLVTLSVTGNLPSVVQFFTGDDAPSKWWSHPLGNEIYNGYQALLDDKDSLQLKLVDRKVTLAHRSLWPTLLRLAIDPARRKSVKGKLSKPAAKLLGIVEKSGSVRLDFVEPEWSGGSKGLKRAREELERYGAVLTQDEHTERGSHQLVLESWEHFRERARIPEKDLPSLQEATAKISKLVGPHKTTLTS